MTTTDIPRALMSPDDPEPPLDWTAPEDWDAARDTNLVIVYREES
jgi:hypothetical protein